jgi:tetratricopeptide (TPR) repeat protein
VTPALRAGVSFSALAATREIEGSTYLDSVLAADEGSPGVELSLENGPINVRHPDRNALEGFSRGEFSAGEDRWIEDHLRSGCAVCQREVDALLLRTLSSAPCGEPALQDSSLRKPEEESAGWDRLVAVLERRLATVSAERNDAPRLLAELLAYSPGEREILARDRGHFQTLAVCELLIEKSFEERFRHVPLSIELAELGLLLSGQLDADRYGRSVIKDLQARAWAYLGNARRMALDLAGAEEALANAERLAEGGSADPLEEARILDLRASLLADQGRFEQAAELLDLVIDIYDNLREAHRKGRAMISKGVFLGYGGWPEEAIRTIRRGLGLLDWDAEPRLVLMARHNLAWFLNDCGRSEDALQQLQRFRHTYSQFGDPWTELRLVWLSGRIAAGLGLSSEAEESLSEVRRRLLAGGRGYDAALVTMDLANLYLQDGRSGEVKRLAAEMVTFFVSNDIHRHAQAALAVFQQAAELDRITPRLVREIAAYLRRARRNPELRFEEAG